MECCGFGSEHMLNTTTWSANKLLELMRLPPERTTFGLAAAIWEGGLPIDVLPSEGFLEIKLGEDAFAWQLP